MKNKTQKSNFFIFTLLLLAAVSALAYVFYIKSVSDRKIQQELSMGDFFPSFSLNNLANKSNLKLEDVKSQIILVNFWASWCEPCVKEFDSMIQLATQMSEDEFSIVLISQDESKEKAKSFKNSFGTLPKNIVSLFDHELTDERFSKEVGLSALPESFLLDQNRKIIRKVSGFENWAHPQVLEFIKSKYKK